VKRIIALAAGAALVGATPALAQTAPARPVELSVGGGFSLPQGQGLEGTNTGFAVHAGLGIRPASLPVGLRLEAIFTRLGFEEGTFTGEQGSFDFSGSMNIYGATANVVLERPTSGVRPYGIAGAGIYRVDFNSNFTGGEEVEFDREATTEFGVNAGAGLAFTLSESQLFVEARFHSVFTEGESANFIPVVVGLKF
jgi:opacity protein-like surface antigen